MNLICIIIRFFVQVAFWTFHCVASTFFCAAHLVSCCVAVNIVTKLLVGIVTQIEIRWALHQKARAFLGAALFIVLRAASSILAFDHLRFHNFCQAHRTYVRLARGNRITTFITVILSTFPTWALKTRIQRSKL
jgi:hypothetical protein